jgi:toxin-antitoxin system PIN domain toxin
LRLLDINVLLYAHRDELPLHSKAMRILRSVLDSDRPFALSDVVLAGFVRLACHRKTFKPPTPLKSALAFLEAVRAAPNAVAIAPGPHHWELFTQNLAAPGVHGDDAWDAYLAALAIEADCTWVSFDQGFARFPKLKWINALKDEINA